MRRRKAQDLSTAERESIAQEFLFKINKAAEDDEEAVMASKPALNKLKLLKVRLGHTFGSAVPLLSFRQDIKESFPVQRLIAAIMSRIRC